jgi:type II secretory pathway component PulL
MKPHLPMKHSVIALSVLSAISVTSLSAIAEDSKEQRADTEQKNRNYSSYRPQPFLCKQHRLIGNEKTADSYDQRTIYYR